MTTMTIDQAQDHPAELLARAADGEEVVIVIVRDDGSTFSELATELPKMHDVALLAITVQRLETISPLPLHHRDPFDRLLIAQCIAEDMTLLSNDVMLDRHGVERIW